MLEVLMNWYRQRFESLALGDEVEFSARVDIAMGDAAWVNIPGWGTELMYGDFTQPGQRLVVRGRVHSLSSFVHISYDNYLPGHKPGNMWRCYKNTFCCRRISVRKVLKTKKSKEEGLLNE